MSIGEALDIVCLSKSRGLSMFVGVGGCWSAGVLALLEEVEASSMKQSEGVAAGDAAALRAPSQSQPMFESGKGGPLSSAVAVGCTPADGRMNR